MNLFDWLKNVTYQKRPWTDFSEKDRKEFNRFMVLRYLSMSPYYIGLVNTIQGYEKIPNRNIYDFFKSAIPKRQVWLKYIKAKKEKTTKQDLLVLADYFEVGTKDVKEYIQFLPKKDIKHILDLYDGKSSKRKKKS